MLWNILGSARNSDSSARDLCPRVLYPSSRFWEGFDGDLSRPYFFYQSVPLCFFSKASDELIHFAGSLPEIFISVLWTTIWTKSFPTECTLTEYPPTFEYHLPFSVLARRNGPNFMLFVSFTRLRHRQKCLFVVLVSP